MTRHWRKRDSNCRSPRKTGAFPNSLLPPLSAANPYRDRCSAGSGLDRIVKMTVVLADAADYDEMNRVWREFFPTDPPARTTCALQLSNGNGVEIECIALAARSPS